MIKKIKVEQLRPGVFVHDFNCGWLHHPFLADRIKIKNDRDVEKVVKYGIRELYIDTDKGLDVDAAPTQQEAAEEVQSELEQLSGSAAGGADGSSLKDEIARAKKLIAEAKQAIEKLMQDVRLGKRMDLGQAQSTVEKMTDSVFRHKDALTSLLRIKTADEYTYLHSMSVSALCISFAQGIGLDAAQVKQIGIGGLLHDIGKMRVPMEILNKPGALSETEFAIMKNHVKAGEAVLQQYTQLDDGCTCVTSHHHERLDGTGYPQGLKGDQISLFGQMAAIVDIYDALSSERCYKKAMSPTDSLKKIFEWSQSYLNRDLVEKFVVHLGIYPIATLVRLESELVGIVAAHGDKALLRPVVRVIYDIGKAQWVEPFDLDLDRQFSLGNPHEIVACESLEKWHIQPEQYLSL